MEGGSGFTVLNVGFLHIAAAHDYDWAIEAAIVAAEIDIYMFYFFQCTGHHMSICIQEAEEVSIPNPVCPDSHNALPEQAFEPNLDSPGSSNGATHMKSKGRP